MQLGLTHQTLLHLVSAELKAPSALLLHWSMQIELRVLAQLSKDRELCRLLNNTGAQGDVFRVIWASWRGGRKQPPAGAGGGRGMIPGQGAAGAAGAPPGVCPGTAPTGSV
jgi:hypothetical protein